MKKILFLLLLALPLVCIGCSSDDNNDDYSLDGTTWTNNDDGYREIKFGKKDFTFLYIYQEERDDDSGSYSFSNPIITFTAVNRDTGKKENVSASIIGGSKFIFGDFEYHKK